MCASKAAIRRRKIPKWKIEEVKLLKELLLKYNTVGIANLMNIGSYQLYEIRKALRDKAVLRVSKNTLMKIAIKEICDKKPGLEKLVDHLHGQNIFIFTNMNPFELQQILDKNKVSRPARAGDIVPGDITIPAGNTGLAPGPIMSRFSQFKVPVKIEEGSIVVLRDTVVAKKGERISSELAELLNKLGIEPIRIGLELKAAYVDGIVIPGDKLKINLDEYKQQLSEAHRNALVLAFAICYPIREALPLILQDAHVKALLLASNAVLPVSDGLMLAIQKALSEASVLSALLAPKCPELGLSTVTPEAERKEEKKEEKEEKKEEKSEEEEIAGGLASLFG